MFLGINAGVARFLTRCSDHLKQPEGRTGSRNKLGKHGENKSRISME